MALTGAQKKKVIELSDGGMEPKEISRKLKVHHIAVYGTLRQEGMRRGTVKHTPRGPSKKKKVTIQEERTVECEPDEKVGVLPSSAEDFEAFEEDLTSSPYSASRPITGSPLFPSRPTNEIDNVLVRRILRNPRARGEGTLGVLDREADEQVIFQAFGGGRFEIIARNSRGQEIGRATRDVAGPSLNIDEAIPDEETDVQFDGETAPLHSDPQTAEVSELRKALLNMAGNQAQAERERAAEAIRHERELSAERGRQTQDFFKSMMQMQQNAAAQQIAMMESRRAPQSDMMTQLQTLAALRSFMMDGGGGEPPDALSAAIGAVPGILQGLAGLKQQAPVVVQQQIEAPHPRAPIPNPAPVEMTDDDGDEEGDDEDETPPSKEEALDNLAWYLEAQGVPEEVAGAMVGELAKAGDGIVAQYAAKKPAPKPQNGKAAMPEVPPHPIPGETATKSV